MPVSTGSWFLDLLNWSVSFWNGILETGAGLLSESPETVSPGIWDTMKSINTSIQGIGYGLLVLCFLISLFRNTTNIKEFSLQGVFGYFIRFVVGKIAIDYSMSIMSAIITVVLEICGIINTTGESIQMEQVPDNILEKVQSISAFDIGQQLPLWLLSILGVIVTCICAILFLICVYGRFFRVYIHIALAPIGLAGLGGDMTASTGKKYIMSFLSVCLEAAVIVLAIVICKAIISSGTFIGVDLAADASASMYLANYIMSNMFAMILLVTLTFGVSRITKEMFGGM